MNVLLINPPMSLDTAPRFPSFGMAYLVQELKKYGHSVEYLDVDACRYSRSEVVELIERSQPDIVGIGGLVTVYPYLHWLVPEIQRLKPGAPIILGGPVASSLREICFERFAIDFMVIGEGEVTLLELLQQLQGDRKFNAVKGIGFRENGRVVFTPDRPLMGSLDNLPRFDDTLFPMEKLLANSGGIFQIHTQRGCPSNCGFCFNAFRVVGKNVRYRRVRDVVDEIKYFKEKYREKITLFPLTGECITMNKPWILDFCQTLLRENLNINYRVTSRADTLDEERLEWMAKSGCRSISIGIESGSDKILKLMKKGATVEKGRRAIALAKKYIPSLEISIMLGYVGEDRETLAETKRFCKEIGVKPLFFHATPFPGTDLYRLALAKDKIGDEETYRMQLGLMSILRDSINLTDMPDKEAAREIGKLISEVNRHYLWRDVSSSETWRKMWLKARRDGLGKTVTKALDVLKKKLQPDSGASAGQPASGR